VDEFLYAYIIEICRKSSEPVNFIATHVRTAQELLQVCEQVKITWSQVWTVGTMEKNVPGKVIKQCMGASGLYFLDNPRFTSQDRVAVTLKTCIQEMLSSNIGWDTNYPNRRLS
jgi:hypothetical protein